MNRASLARLVVLAALWGGSFLFMRIGAPVLGPVLLIEARVGLAAVFLAAVAVVLRKRLEARRHWRHFLLLGFLNSALPFLLFAYAAKTLPASLLAILNATAPLWGEAIGAAWARRPLARQVVLGLALGVAGVATLVGFDAATLREGAPLAVAAALAGSFSYGVASNYSRHGPRVESFANAHGSMWAATLLLAPLLPFFPSEASPDAGVLASVIALGVACSGVAYLLYFRLVDDVGPTSALTVTFLVPVFGVLWGSLVLGEPVGWHTVAGSLVVIAGTALVTGFFPSALSRGKGVVDA